MSLREKNQKLRMLGFVEARNKKFLFLKTFPRDNTPNTTANTKRNVIKNVSVSSIIISPIIRLSFSLAGPSPFQALISALL